MNQAAIKNYNKALTLYPKYPNPKIKILKKKQFVEEKTKN